MLSVGGFAYVLLYPYLGNNHVAEKRQKMLMKKKAIASREKEANRRKALSDTIKDMEIKGARKTETLPARIAQAGLEIDSNVFLAMSLGVALCVGFVLLMLSQSIFVGALGLVIGGLGLPNWFLKYKKKKRLQAFTEAFPGAIDIIIRGVKAGLPLGDCLKIIASEAPEPLASEFRQVVEAQQMGLTLGEAVDRIAEHIPSAESNFFAIVINIQQKAGGNLSESLSNLSRVLRERKKMRQKIKAMSTEATASASIIGSLPFIVTTLVYITSPDYISLLWEKPQGQVVLVFAAFWMFLGISSMKKMINFDI